ncbi:hypothetical protein [Soonwooa sp.]|uniref:hypothetical protein n=1 Tax=Soonwooa sp. TaxID=1938592 RepID=UPI00289E19EC|nr:hypothetical protein [Soonwooa sp.]
MINIYVCNSDKKISSQKIIFINENLGNYVENDLEFIPNNFTVDTSKQQKISVYQYKGNFVKLKSLSDIPKAKNDDYLATLKNYYGTLSFGNLYFDNTCENSVLPLYYSCNTHSITSYLIYLKKINNNWKIIKVKQLWIS